VFFFEDPPTENRSGFPRRFSKLPLSPRGFRVYNWARWSVPAWLCRSRGYADR